MLRRQHGADDGRALADVGKEGEGEGLSILAVNIPAGEAQPFGVKYGGERQQAPPVWHVEGQPLHHPTHCTRCPHHPLAHTPRTTHCSGASRQVASIQRVKGRALSTRLRIRRPSWRPTSVADGAATTSGAMSCSATWGGGGG